MQGFAQGYYKQATIFQPAPQPNDKRPWNIRNFGPVGLGIDLRQPGFTMHVKNVEPGSPAAKTGKLKVGQIIESINGQTLKDRDPREILGDLITQAEATDGKITLQIRGQGPVDVAIPVMGEYSETWPIDCPKSDRIVRRLADVLAKQDKPRWGSVLFLLSTGEEQDLAVVRRWMAELETIGSMNWEKGYKGIGVCEYYLRTGDQRVLPVIKRAVDELHEYFYDGGWSGRGPAAAFTYSTGSGQLHASGMHCLTFLLLAKTCGVEVDESMFNEALTAFYRFAGKGNVPYGNGLPEDGFRDNGKTSGFAVAMAAAARLTPGGEDTVYAKARDTAAIKAFYATNWFHVAHTGGGMGEIWHHLAMALLFESRPTQYRSYLDTRRWVMELSRRHDGSIGIAGYTDRYDLSATEDEMAWGTYFALTYTLPRKHLHLFGAPHSEHAIAFELPVRPWGTEADDAFLLNTPAEHPSLTMEQVLAETVPDHSSLPAMRRMGDPDVSDELLSHYLHHPEYGLRLAATRNAVRKGRFHLLKPLLDSPDPRIRHVGLMAVAGMFKGDPMPPGQVTPAMVERIAAILEDRDEAWWNTHEAMRALIKLDVSVTAQHRKRLIELVEADSWWLNAAAVQALARIAAHPQFHREVLPPVLEHLADARNVNELNAVWQLKRQLKNASPPVKAFAATLTRKAYLGLPDELRSETGMLIPGGSREIRNKLTELAVLLPGGSDFAKTLPKATLASARSGKPGDMYVFDKFEPNPKIVGKWWHVTNILERQIDDVPGAVASAKRGIEAKKKKFPTGRQRYVPSYLDLKPGGVVDGNFFWSGDMLIDILGQEARRMRMYEIGGQRYLLVEEGPLPARVGEGWSPRLQVYESVGRP